MAIFGVMILIGSLSLTSTVFHQLGLASQSDALALPSGSIRAAIALSLIVLFAIIAIMLFQTLADGRNEPYWVNDIREADLINIEKANSDPVVVAIPTPCPATSIPATPAPAAPAATAPAGAPVPGTPGEPAASACYKVQFVHGTSRDAVDVAKQLLTLIGTLMTAVTSFYFAARPPRSRDGAPGRNASPPNGQPAGNGAPSALPAAAAEVNAAEDGCNIPVTDPTRDEELPPATGGVA